MLGQEAAAGQWVSVCSNTPTRAIDRFVAYDPDVYNSLNPAGV